MSNPFLADLDESYTPYSASGTQTPYSAGGTTPKRRNSTNPFEILSPENEGPIVFDSGSGSAINNNNDDDNSSTKNNNNFASAIADMSADFFQSITSKTYKMDPDDEDVFESDENKTNNNETLKTVKTISFDNGNTSAAVFDPFQTINDDDVPSKRSSIENQQQQQQTRISETDIEPPKNSAKAKDFFNSQVGEMELLAAAVDGQQHLTAPQGLDLYSSDLSDLSTDVSPANNAVNMEDVRSAFNAYSATIDEEIPKFEPLTSSEILKRKISVDNEPPMDSDSVKTDPPKSSQDQQCDSFDPFGTVVNDSPTADDINENSKKLQFDLSSRNPQLNESPRSDSLDLNDVGQPNKNAEGIINTAFNDEQPEIDVDISEVAVENIPSSTLTNIVNDIEERRESIDPFDTSNFDSAAFDEFESRFEGVKQTSDANKAEDAFASPYKTAKPSADDGKNTFDTFEPFEPPKQPENTPYKISKPKKKKDSFEDSFDDDDDDDEPEETFRVVIRAKVKDPSGQTDGSNLALPLLPPPPKSPKREPPQQRNKQDGEDDGEPVNEEELILTSYRKAIKPKKTTKSFIDEEFERFFASSENRRGSESTADATTVGEPEWPTAFGDAASKQRTAAPDSPASPQTPLYDEDTSQPLEDFPPPYLGDGWEMMLRHPAKKKLTANRYWKKIFVRFIPETCLLQLFNKKEDTKPFQELPLQASYSLSEICAQQYDQYGKIFTVKVQYIFYRERVGVRPGQIAKVMQGQIQSMGDFARLGMPVEHSPQISELLKIGTLEYNDMKEFVTVVEEAMFRLTVHRDRALTYRTEEIQCCVQDECYVEQNKIGIVEKQLARVRIFFLAFLNGMPVVDVGINDLRRQGKEVVGRHDILPVVTEEWIRVERAEFHSCVQDAIFETEQIVRLIPPDACQFEMMRFRIRPPKNRELPLQVSAYMNITPTKMELKCDVLVPGCISRKHGQIPCEDIAIRFHIPECWVYFFRVEKHFRYGAVHSTNRRQGKLKGLDRILGTATNPEPQLIEVTAGLAKYEHAYHSIVWRIPKLPKDGQGAYTQQLMLVRLPLSSFDRIPETFYDFVHVEFRMPSTTVSHTTLRSISLNTENSAEKFVRYTAKYEYKIGLNITYDENKQEPEYILATALNNGSAGKNSEQEHSSEEEAEAPGDDD